MPQPVTSVTGFAMTVFSWGVRCKPIGRTEASAPTQRLLMEFHRVGVPDAPLPRWRATARVAPTGACKGCGRRPLSHGFAVPACPPSCQPIPGHCRARQSGHFLEIASLLPPLAALRRFPLTQGSLWGRGLRIATTSDIGHWSRNDTVARGAGAALRNWVLFCA